MARTSTGHWVEGRWPAPRNRPQVSRRLASLMTAHRTGREAASYGHRSGNVARRSLYRVSVGDPRIFSTRQERSVTRTRFVILLDCSGSMRGERFSVAAQAVWDLHAAARFIPTATSEVWGHTTGSIGVGDGSAPVHPNAASLCSGEQFVTLNEFANGSTSVEEFAKNLAHFQLRGNEDGFALEGLHSVVTPDRRPGERIVYVLVSDGQPIYNEGYAEAAKHVEKVVGTIRKGGDAVIGVSVSPTLNTRTQSVMYGPGGFVGYQSDIGAVIRDFAAVAAKYLR